MQSRATITNPIIRTLVVVVAVALILSGVTFAALQSQQAKFTGSVIQTAIANLQVSNDGTSYANSQSGFAFGNLVPGGTPVPISGYNFFLKNAGGTTLTLKLAVSSTPTNPDNVDFTKVHVILTPLNGGSVQNFTLKALIDAYADGGLPILSAVNLPANQIVQYSLQATMDRDALNGPSATVNNIDFSFGGLAV